MAGSASAQAPDSVAIPEETPDSTAVEPTQRPSAGPPIDVDVYWEGGQADSTPLVRLFSADPVEMLDGIPGNFRYSTGNLGWLDQISFQGLSPGSGGLTLDGIPLHDPVSGRPLFEMLPVDLLAYHGLFSGRHSTVAGAVFATRRYDVMQPQTELRYRAGGPGYQSISAMHVQQRRISFVGTPATLQVLFRYASSGWDGDYPNSFSDLTQIDGRVGLYAQNWALRITNFLTRRHGGAHGGVIVRPGSDFDSIYTRFNAAVSQPNATFRTKRSDLRVAYDRLLSDSLLPLSVQFSWVSHVRRYRNVIAPASLIHEYSIAAVQELPAPLDDQHLTARIISRFDDVRSTSVFADTSDLSRSSLEALLESRTALGDLTLMGDIGFLQSDGHTLPQARLGFNASWLGWDVSSDFSLAGRIPSRLEVAGSDHIGTIVGADLDPERFRRINLALRRPFGTSSIGLEGFVVSTDKPLDIWAVTVDSFVVVQGTEAITRYGLTGELGWRRRTDRGFYSDVQATIGASNTADDRFLTAVEESVPSLHARMRFGTRYLLFQGDLDLDMYVVGRYWSSFRSRVYDPITAVPAVGGEEARMIGNSGTLDVRVEAGIRSASLYVGFENVLSGVSYPGTTLVAPYPLPAQAFRFGVFWPIDN